jgi:MftR C-terminal domain
LFHGQQQLTDAFLAGVGDAPPDASAIELGVCALRSAASYFPDDRRPDSRLRQSVIDKNPALQEREAHKMAVLGTALAEALRARGVDDLVADVAARTTVMAFGITFERWIRRGQRRSFTDVAADVLDEFAAVAGRLPRHR